MTIITWRPAGHRIKERKFMPQTLSASLARLDIIAHTIQYANITRYVTPAPKGGGTPDLPNFVDIPEAKQQGLVPPIYFQSAGELTFPQPWVPIQHYNPPGTTDNYWWDFDMWI